MAADREARRKERKASRKAGTKKSADVMGMNSPQKFPKPERTPLDPKHQALAVRKVQSTRPKVVETSVKREKVSMVAFDSKKKSKLPNTSGNAAVNKTSLNEKAISPRKVMSFSMLDDAETNNTKANLRLGKQETEYESKATGARGPKGAFKSDFGTSDLVSTPNSSRPASRKNSVQDRKPS